MRQRYCDILGVRLDSSKEEIKKAYKRLASIYNPDGDKRSNSEKWQEIRKAYNYLMGYRKHNYGYRRVHLSFDDMRNSVLLLIGRYLAISIIYYLEGESVSFIVYGSLLYVLFTSFCLMIVPTIYSLTKPKMYLFRYKKVCLWNSIGWFIIVTIVLFEPLLEFGVTNIIWINVYFYYLIYIYYYINTCLIPYFHKGIYEKC